MKTKEEFRVYKVEQSRRHRAKDREAYNAYHLANYYRNRAEKIEELGGKCQDCEETEKLDITPRGLLCRSCVMKRRRKFTHGTYYGFAKAKCQCMMCLARKLSYQDERNRKRRKKFRTSKQDSAREKWGQMKRPPPGTL